MIDCPTTPRPGERGGGGGERAPLFGGGGGGACGPPHALSYPIHISSVKKNIIKKFKKIYIYIHKIKKIIIIIINYIFFIY